MAKSRKKLELDRSPSAKYNRLTMPELEEKAKTTEATLEKRSQSQTSRLGSTAKLTGEWICDEEVIIEGQIQGKVDSGNHDLRIEREAKVQATLQGKNITILGKVTGNVTRLKEVMQEKEVTLEVP